MKVMRPRALLHITAICLLLAAATVWAQLPHVEPEAPAAKKPELFPKQEFPKQEFPKQEFPKQEFPKQEFPKREFPKREFPKQALLGKEAAAEEAAFAASPQFKLLSKVVPGLTPGDVSIVPGAVKAFSHKFETGAKNPKSYLPQVSPQLLSKWNKVTQDKRIFIIGAGKDSAEVSEAAKSLEAQGNAVFFYDFCRPLCSSEAVGAMFGTSGQTMLYHTSSADLSQYVTVEVATARFIDGLAKPVILISTEELLAAGAFKMHVVEMRMPTPTPSPVK